MYFFFFGLQLILAAPSGCNKMAGLLGTGGGRGLQVFMKVEKKTFRRKLIAHKKLYFSPKLTALRSTLLELSNFFDFRFFTAYS